MAADPHERNCGFQRFGGRHARLACFYRMMDPRELRIGTSGFHYPGPPPKGWCGAFYPEKATGFDQLEYYSQIFNTVEINSSFYGPPSEKTAAAWAKRTPSDFTFAVKLWQKFTHAKRVGRGRSADIWEPVTQEDINLVRAGLQPLVDSGKLGILLLQYPAGFYFTPENLAALQRTLSLFPGWPKGVELRHKSWSDRSAETGDVLARNDSTWILIDEPKFASSIRQNFESVGSALYFRAHGRNAQKWWNPEEAWERYDYCYSRAEIKKMAQRIAAAAGQPEVRRGFAFFNNHARANAAANAIMLSQELGVRLKTMPSEAMAHQFPQLAMP